MTNMFNLSQFATSKKRVLLRGPVLTQSGYGVHARQIAHWLFNQQDISIEVHALPWGNTPWLIDGKLDSGFIGTLLEKTVDPTGQLYDVTVQLQLPHEWDPKLGKFNIGITAGVETDSCNPSWIRACNSMSHIVVPSKHVETCLRNTGTVTVPITVVPEAYNSAIGKATQTKIDDLKFSTPFNFLMFGQLTGNNPENDRKNIFYAVKWLCETFSNDKDVGIVIKTNAGRNTSEDRNTINNIFTNLLREVRKSEFPKIHLLHGNMSDEEVSSLYRHSSIKALVTPTRGEGYGLPILEAAASGLPVIATSWSGHVDFLSKGKYIDIDYKLEDIHQSRIDGNIFVKGSKWAKPSEEDFKKKIVKFRNSSALPREWAKDLQTKIISEYSLDSVIKQYENAFRSVI